MNQNQIYTFNNEIGYNIQFIKNKLRSVKNTIIELEKKINTIPIEETESPIFKLTKVITNPRIGSFEQFGNETKDIDLAIEKLMILYKVIEDIEKN